MQKPLDEKGLTDLDAFLTFCSEGIESLTQLHGFFCAILTIPHLSIPNHWQEIVFGKDFLFETREQALYIIGLVLQLFNQIDNDLQKKCFSAPLLFEEGKIIPYEAEVYELVEDWCNGYLEGALFDPLWRERDLEMSLLFPLGVLTDFNSIEIKFFSMGYTQRETLRGEYIKIKSGCYQNLPTLIRFLYDYWSKERSLK